MEVRFITCLVFIIDSDVTRLVLIHRILVFKIDFKLDLLQMALNFMLLQDSCIRPKRVRSKVRDSYIPIFLVFFSDSS